MPLSTPSGAPAGFGVDRTNVIFETKLFSDGADASVDYFSCLFDVPSNLAVVGGNDSFVGFLTDFRLGKVVQSPALPSSVIPSFPISSLQPNGINGGLIAVSNGESAQTIDGGATWTAIASNLTAFAVGAIDQVSWRGSQIFSGNTRQTIPQRDYSVSLDNGVSWTGQFFTGSQVGVSPNKIRKSPNDAKMFVMGQNGSLSITSSADLTAATWVNFNFGALFGLGVNSVDLAFNADASKIIYTATNASIAVSVDGGVTWAKFPDAANYFMPGLAGFLQIDWIVFIADLGGFMLGNAAQVAFIPEAGNLQTMTAVSVATVSALGTIEDACAMSNGTDALVPILDNALITAKAA